MVIGPGKDGIAAFVILGDSEFIPENMNNEKVVVFRQGDSTNRQLQLVKPFGKLADAELLKPPAPPICTYNAEGGNPLHEHADGTFWFYEETWSFEHGPYESYELGYEALVTYCEELQSAREKALTESLKDATVVSDENGTKVSTVELHQDSK